MFIIYNPTCLRCYVSRVKVGLPTSMIVSHHPPISAFFYISPGNHVSILGELQPKSKFLGNSVSTNMEGENRITLLGRPEDGGECDSTCCLLCLVQLTHRENVICSCHLTRAVLRVCHHHAKHVCPWNIVREDGIGVGRYLHSQERKEQSVL